MVSRLRRIRGTAEVIITVGAMQLNYQLLICDLDGTLLNGEEIAIQCLAGTLARFQLPEPEGALVAELCRVHYIVRSSELWSRLAGSCTEKVVQACIQHYDLSCHELLHTRPPLFPHVHEVIRAVKNAGVQLVVLSNRDQADLTAALGACDLNPYVDLAVGVGGRVQPKPDLSALHLAIRPVFGRIPPDGMLVCGDSSTDLGFARAAALSCCWATYGYGDANECAVFQPEFTIGDIRELLGVLDGSSFRERNRWPFRGHA